jgi:hypothetical protein
MVPGMITGVIPEYLLIITVAVTGIMPVYRVVMLALHQPLASAMLMVLAREHQH